MQEFVRVAGVHDGFRILDVGGTPAIWRLLSVRPKLVFLNLPRTQEETEGVPAGADLVFGDGCALPFASQSFDLVFSNSVIEHVGSLERQRLFAQEVARVGQGYWVQTPNRTFPVEAHLLTPGIHFLPKRWQRRLVTRFTVWEYLSRPSPDQREYYLRHYLEDVRLLNARELAQLFPDAIILRERWLGLTKSLVAVRLPQG